MTVSSVLVTGASSGIGAALAAELAARGCRVVVSGRRADLLEAVAESSPLVSACSGDVTDAAHRSALVAELASVPGPRAIVHAAGYFQIGLLDTLTVADWRRSFEVNVEARWALSQESVVLLDGGRVLFVGSDAGATPRAGAAAYSVAQSASETLRRALQAEWAGSSIAVAGFKPGLVDTDMVRGFMQLSPEEFPARAAYDEYFSNGQVSTPETIARFATWLLLDVPAERFSHTEWDVRSDEYRSEWSG